MRITEGMKYSAALQGQTRAAQRLFDASRVASSGERVAAPSDDPTAWAAAVGHEARIARLGARSTAATRASGDLEAAEWRRRETFGEDKPEICPTVPRPDELSAHDPSGRSAGRPNRARRRR